RIARHSTTGMTTLRTASENREGLLLYTYDAMRKETASGQNTYLIVPGSPNFRPLLDMIERQSIRMGRLTAPATLRATRIDTDAVESRSFPAGTIVISSKQPLGGLAQTLLEKSPAFSKGFVEEQQKKTEADEPDEFYDLTSWSLPLAMNVEAYVTTAPITSSVQAYAPAASVALRTAAYGYLVDGNDPNIYRLAGRMLKSNVKFSVSDDVVALAERTY